MCCDIVLLYRTRAIIRHAVHGVQNSPRRRVRPPPPPPSRFHNSVPLLRARRATVYFFVCLMHRFLCRDYNGLTITVTAAAAAAVSLVVSVCVAALPTLAFFCVYGPGGGWTLWCVGTTMIVCHHRGEGGARGGGGHGSRQRLCQDRSYFHRQGAGAFIDLKSRQHNILIVCTPQYMLLLYAR